MKPPEDKRPPMVVASQVLQETTSAVVSMAIFPLFGHWLDSKWSTSPWLTIIGVVFGFSVGMKQLMNLGKPRKRQSGKKSSVEASESEINDEKPREK